MAEHRYEPHEIERKWQDIWERERTWEVSNDVDGAPRSYVLEMLPYPSGEPHMGHLKNYSVGDAVAHFRRRNGMRVLHPMGYDAFGLPAENNAIKTGKPPREATEESIASFQRQFRSWGISIDWSREFGTHEPRYYRWTQWIFLQLFERGLAYRKEAAVNWCPKDATVLANEQVIDGHCERCGTAVELRQLEQWFFRITDYADRLLDDLATIDWPHHVVTMQRNWIGRSEGAEVTFSSPETGTDYSVFTTRPDTLFGATFFVMAPEHPDVLRLAAGTEHEQAVRGYVNQVLTESKEERADTDRKKTGVPLGRSVINPVNGAAALLLFVEQHSRASFRDKSHGHFKLLPAIATQGAEHVSGKALRVNSHQRCHGKDVAHDQRDRSFGTAVSTRFAFKAQNTELAPAGGELRRSDLFGGVGTHESIIRGGAGREGTEGSLRNPDFLSVLRALSF